MAKSPPMQEQHARKSARRGFTLVEVLVFTAVFSMTLIVTLGIIAYSSVSLKNAEYRAFATHYSQELLEWVKYQKDEVGYTALRNYADDSYCFDETPIEGSWVSYSGACDADTYGLTGFYQRELTFTNIISNEQLTAVVTTSWMFLGVTRSVVLQTVMSNL